MLEKHLQVTRSSTKYGHVAVRHCPVPWQLHASNARCDHEAQCPAMHGGVSASQDRFSGLSAVCGMAHVMLVRIIEPLVAV
jgi:hypothetical protein